MARLVGDVGLDLEATAGGAGAGGAEERSMVPSAALGGGGGDLLSRGIPMLCLFSLSWPSLRVGGLGVEEAHGRGREKRRVRKKKRGKTLPFLRRSSGKRPRASLALTLLTFFRLPKKKNSLAPQNRFVSGNRSLPLSALPLRLTGASLFFSVAVHQSRSRRGAQRAQNGSAFL